MVRVCAKRQAGRFLIATDLLEFLNIDCFVVVVTVVYWGERAEGRGGEWNWVIGLDYRLGSSSLHGID